MAQYIKNINEINITSAIGEQQELSLEPDRPFYLQNVGNKTIYFGSDGQCLLQLEPNNTIGEFLANNDNKMYVKRLADDGVHKLVIAYFEEGVI